MTNPHNEGAPGDPGPLLSALVDVVFRDGRFEVERAKGRRGVLRLNIELELGDNGVPLNVRHSLVFEQRRHIKDGLRG